MEAGSEQSAATHEPGGGVASAPAALPTSAEVHCQCCCTCSGVVRLLLLLRCCCRRRRHCRCRCRGGCRCGAREGAPCLGGGARQAGSTRRAGRRGARDGVGVGGGRREARRATRADGPGTQPGRCGCAVAAAAVAPAATSRPTDSSFPADCRRAAARLARGEDRARGACVPLARPGEVKDIRGAAARRRRLCAVRWGQVSDLASRSRSRAAI